MYNNKKVVVVTPSGRKTYLNLLKNYILNNPIVDEWQLWFNTTDDDNINYLKFLNNSNFKISIVTVNGPIGNCYQIHKFFKYCTKNNTIYIRLDDDVIWMEPNSLENLIRFRIKNPEYFLVFGNIVNNSICDHIHQKNGALKIDCEIGYDCLDKNGWENSDVAEKKHINLIRAIKNQKTNIYKFDKWVLENFERFSINAISWLGEDFAAFDGNVGSDEEAWLTQVKPKELGRRNCICGESLFSHFSFHTQSNHLLSTNILDEYKNLLLETNLGNK